MYCSGELKSIYNNRDKDQRAIDKLFHVTTIGIKIVIKFYVMETLSPKQDYL